MQIRLMRIPVRQWVTVCRYIAMEKKYMDSKILQKERKIKDQTRPGFKRMWIGLNVVQDMMMLWTLWGATPMFDTRANEFVTNLSSMVNNAGKQKRRQSGEDDGMKACLNLMDQLKSVGTDSDYHKQSAVMVRKMGDTVTILLWIGMWIRDNIIKTDNKMVKGKYLGAKKDTWLPQFLINENEGKSIMSEIEDIAPTTELIERKYQGEEVKVPARIISLAVLLFKTPMKGRMSESLQGYYDAIKEQVSQAKFHLDFYPDTEEPTTNGNDSNVYRDVKKEKQINDDNSSDEEEQNEPRKKKTRKNEKYDSTMEESGDDGDGGDELQEDSAQVNTYTLSDRLKNVNEVDHIADMESIGWVKDNFASKQKTLVELFDMVFTCRMVGYYIMVQCESMVTEEWWLKKLAAFSLEEHGVQYANESDKNKREDSICQVKDRDDFYPPQHVVVGVIKSKYRWEDMKNRDGKKLLWILKKGTTIFGWERRGEWDWKEKEDESWEMDLVMNKKALQPTTERLNARDQNEIMNWEKCKDEFMANNKETLEPIGIKTFSDSLFINDEKLDEKKEEDRALMSTINDWNTRTRYDLGKKLRDSYQEKNDATERRELLKEYENEDWAKNLANAAHEIITVRGIDVSYLHDPDLLKDLANAAT